jgi:membrane protease YdiL (CAAX protease family)
MTVARNVAIVLVLAALVAFLPGGSKTADVIAAVLSTLIVVSLVYILARLYRERRLDLEGLGDRWRGILYGAIGAVLLAMAARTELFESGAGTVVWFATLGGASYALYRVWRQYREYA